MRQVLSAPTMLGFLAEGSRPLGFSPPVSTAVLVHRAIAIHTRLPVVPSPSVCLALLGQGRWVFVEGAERYIVIVLPTDDALIIRRRPTVVSRVKVGRAHGDVVACPPE